MCAVFWGEDRAAAHLAQGCTAPGRWRQRAFVLSWLLCFSFWTLLCLLCARAILLELAASEQRRQQQDILWCDTGVGALIVLNKDVLPKIG